MSLTTVEDLGPTRERWDAKQGDVMGDGVDGSDDNELMGQDKHSFCSNLLCFLTLKLGKEVVVGHTGITLLELLLEA